MFFRSTFVTFSQTKIDLLLVIN